MEKQVSIVVAASGEIKDIGISPGVTVKEVLNETDLRDYQLSRKGGESLNPDTDLFEEVSDHEKLYATPQDVSVGDGGSPSPLPYKFVHLIEKLCQVIKNYTAKIPETKRYQNKKKNRLTPHIKPKQTRKIRVVRTRTVRIPSQPSMTKKKQQINPQRKKEVTLLSNDKEYPYWVENDWQKTGKNNYVGYYKTNYGKWKGLIEENFRGSYSFYIFNPPEILKEDKHWSCLFPKGNGKYWVHFSEKPKDISAGIMIVEQIINSCFKKGEEKCSLNVPDIKKYVSNLLRKMSDQRQIF